MTTPKEPKPDEWVDAEGKKMKLRFGFDDVLAILAALWQKVTRAEEKRDR